MAIDPELYEEAFTSYQLNADYLEAASATKARAFITACTRLLAFTEETSEGGNQSRFNHKEMREEKERAARWLDAQTGAASATSAGSTRFVSLENYRR